ncbi:hypothetical protein J8F10_37220 [Gemmata sp. G18]|uniref:Flagellar biosynthetic protein FliO n=1 Tax=Gemmata palustris TaxID=2822762 RepID=A0ABS5C5H0_9BACT|nr:hypothetical protein [Gemmata palustris]MBP3960897.1 hypothetical protein [Gemmata palustris]
MTRTFVALAVSLGTAAPLFAGPTSGFEYTAPTTPAAPDFGALVLRLVLMTVVLVGLCVLVLGLARRANRPAGGTGDGGGRVKHEGTLALDRVCAVHMLTVDGQTVAVTTDATGLRSMVVLAEPFDAALNAATEPDVETEPAPPAPVAPAVPKWSPNDVHQLLQRLVSRTDGPVQGAGLR